MTEEVPPYPHHRFYVYKQANFGLYARARVRFGNNRAKSEFRTKTRRRWSPNIQRHRFFSEALGESVQLKVTTRVMRTIDKVGGLDNYLLGEKSARIKDLGPMGWTLRWRLMQTPVIQERFAKERRALGLEEEPESRREIREWWEAELQSKPGREEKAERFRKFNERKDVWRYQPIVDAYKAQLDTEVPVPHRGPRTAQFGQWVYYAQWAERSQEIIDDLADRLEMWKRIFGTGVSPEIDEGGLEEWQSEDMSTATPGPAHMRA
jgi:ribosomal protein L28